MGSCKTSQSLHPPARFLKVDVEALLVFSHLYCPVTHCALKAVSLEELSALVIGRGCRTYILRTRRGVRNSDYSGLDQRSTSEHIF